MPNSPKLYAFHANEFGISAMTHNRSCANLDFAPDEEKCRRALGLPEGTRVLWFARLSVLKPHQNNGEGSFLLRHILRACDEKGWAIINAPHPYESQDWERLLRFYARFGFTPETLGGDALWVRRPLPAPAPTPSRPSSSPALDAAPAP